MKASAAEPDADPALTQQRCEALDALSDAEQDDLAEEIEGRAPRRCSRWVGSRTDRSRGYVAAWPRGKDSRVIAAEAQQDMDSGKASIWEASERVRKAKEKAVKKAAVVEIPHRRTNPGSVGSRRTHVQMIEAVVHGIEGYGLVMDEIATAGFDQSVTCSEAARIRDGLTKALRSINRINTLLLTKERTS